MKAIRRSEINGGQACGPAADGLYRYVPVPPVYRDAEGYPIEDGMTQNNHHLNQTTQWYHILRLHLPNATVASDLAMPYERGARDKVMVPDLLVALRAPPYEHRRSYKLWKNPRPDLVIEMLSDTTWTADVGSKKHTCEHLRIPEYWLFDPLGLHSPTPLIGYRLCGKSYRRIDADAAGRLPSKVLGLDLHVRDGWLRFHNPATGKDLSTHDESVAGRAAAEAGRAAAEAGRAAAERREAEERHARQQAEQRAAAAERELVRLRAHLNKR